MLSLQSHSPRIKSMRHLCLIPLVVVGTAAILTAQITVQGRESDQFVDSMGINVHMASRTTPYHNYPAINRALESLGMRHIRDEINDTRRPFVDEMQRIGRIGYHLCGLIEGGNDYPPLGTKLEAHSVVPMIRNLQPVIEAVEGPNEPDNSSFLYDGVSYPWGAIHEAQDLWQIVKSDPAIAFLPVIALSEGNAPDFAHLGVFTPPPIDYANLGNMHAYQGGGVGDSALADYYIPYARTLTGRDVLWTTEMGYHNNTNYLHDGEQQGVSERASAIYLPIAFFSGFNLGVQRTFSYELIDESFDLNLTRHTGEGQYGILRSDGSPKPAFLALKNLIALLREPGAPRFESDSLNITFEGAPSTLGYTLLQKSNGDYYLALWNDIPVYQTATQGSAGHDLYPDRVPMTVAFSTAHALTVYAPNDLTGLNPTSTYTLSTTPNSIQIDLPAQILLLKISGDD